MPKLQYEEEIEELSLAIRNFSKKTPHKLSLSTRSRIWVYQSTLLLSSFEVLKDYYPIVYKFLGENAFKPLVGEFILYYGLQEDSLDLVGEKFVEIFSQENFEHFQNKDLLKALSNLDFILMHPKAPSQGQIEMDPSFFKTYFQIQESDALNAKELNLTPSNEFIILKWSQNGEGEIEFSL